jgi:hypothetical protein
MECAACGAEIRRVTLPEGRKVTIDARSEFETGHDRYMVEGEDLSRARPVSPTWKGFSYGDHSKTCPNR